MNFLKELFQKEVTKKICVLLIIVLFFYITRGLLDIFLLTFLFSYLIYSLESFITKLLLKYNVRTNQLAITILLYCLLFVSIALLFYKYIPLVVRESKNIFKLLTTVNVDNISIPFSQYITPLIKDLDVSKYVNTSSTYLLKLASTIGNWSLNAFMSIMLSMFFMLEKDKNKKFVEKLSRGRYAGLFKYIGYFARNFMNSFGKVIQAQIFIAMTNSLLSIIFLRILGFPQLLALGLMIFILSLIPVAGVIISLVPLTLIAYNIGGVIKIAYVLIMIAVLHCLETYILNPKFMSAKTDLPVFFVFVILIISEYFMGTWGLLLGIPLFMFILDLIGINVKDENISKNSSV